VEKIRPAIQKTKSTLQQTQNRAKFFIQEHPPHPTTSSGNLYSLVKNADFFFKEEIYSER